MRITKFGHCCMLVEEGSARILIDPGEYTTGQNSLKGLHAVLITHGHEDHCDVGSLRTVLANNPDAKVFTNRGVAALLGNEKVPCDEVEEGQGVEAGGVKIDVVGRKHAVIYPGLPQADNTGYIIADRFFCPGDALNMPGRQIDVLAVPIAGPWIKLSEGIDYAKAVRPKVCFPVHDGALKDLGPIRTVPSRILGPLGIRFIVPEQGKAMEL